MKTQVSSPISGLFQLFLLILSPRTERSKLEQQNFNDYLGSDGFSSSRYFFPMMGFFLEFAKNRSVETMKCFVYERGKEIKT